MTRPGIMASASLTTLAVWLALLVPSSAAFHPRSVRVPLRQRASRLHGCAAEDVRKALEVKLKHAVAREDYKAAAALKAQLDAAPVPVAPLYASLQQRATQLASRRAAIVRERDHIKSLASAWPECEMAQQSLWDLWFGAEGETARKRLLEADGEAAKLQALIEEYPDWVEPANRLARSESVV